MREKRVTKELHFYAYTHVQFFSSAKRRREPLGFLIFFFHSFCESRLKPDGIIKIKEVPLSASRDAISMLMDRCFLKEEIKDIKGVRRINSSLFFNVESNTEMTNKIK